MLHISGSNGNLKVQSHIHDKDIDGNLINLDVKEILRVGSASLYEAEFSSTDCKALSFIGTKNKSIDNNCPFELYTIETDQGFIVVDKAENIAYISESLAYINRVISSDEKNLLEVLTKNGFKPISINLNNLLLRHPLNTDKLDQDKHGIFDYQHGDNLTNYTLTGVVELDTLDNRLDGRLFKKCGKLKSVCDFEINYINPVYSLDDLKPEESNKIGAITLTNFDYDKAKLLLVPMLFKTDVQLRAFEDSMKAEGRSSVIISRPSIHGFCVQTLIDFPNAEDILQTDATVRKIVIFPTLEAPTLLVEQFE